MDYSVIARLLSAACSTCGMHTDTSFYLHCTSPIAAVTKLLQCRRLTHTPCERFQVSLKRGRPDFSAEVEQLITKHHAQAHTDMGIQRSSIDNGSASDLRLSQSRLVLLLILLLILLLAVRWTL
jgi:hypothetical protein